MSLPFRPLGMIKNLIDNTTFEITYVYEDLIFIEHNDFLLQMGEEGEQLYIRFNVDTSAEEYPAILEELQSKGEAMGFSVQEYGGYRMSQEEGEENFQLELIDP